MPDPLRDTAQDRLATLRQELAGGRDALKQLEQRRAQIADTLLRIEGAMQVLDEVADYPRRGDDRYARTPTRKRVRIYPESHRRRDRSAPDELPRSPLEIFASPKTTAP